MKFQSTEWKALVRLGKTQQSAAGGSQEFLSRVTERSSLAILEAYLLFSEYTEYPGWSFQAPWWKDNSSHALPLYWNPSFCKLVREAPLLVLGNVLKVLDLARRIGGSGPRSILPQFKLLRKNAVAPKLKEKGFTFTQILRAVWFHQPVYTCSRMLLPLLELVIIPGLWPVCSGHFYFHLATSCHQRSSSYRFVLPLPLQCHSSSFPSPSAVSSC